MPDNRGFQAQFVYIFQIVFLTPFCNKYHKSLELVDEVDELVLESRETNNKTEHDMDATDDELHDRIVQEPVQPPPAHDTEEEVEAEDYGSLQDPDQHCRIVQLDALQSDLQQ